MKSSGIVALLTDFGDRDAYVGAMKGVMLGINPRLTLVDLCHGIAAQDVAAGAFQLRSVRDLFPLGTVFLAVVDPGVGGPRRSVAVEFDRGWLVGPDNGLLTLGLEVVAAVALTEPRFWRAGAEGLSATFQGRDLFAPVAAHLASGVRLEALGDRLDPADLVRLARMDSVVGPGGVEGVVQAIDGYGNLILSIENRVAERAGRLRIGAESRLVILGTSYGAVPIGELVCVPGSLGWLEVACTGGSAAVVLGAKVGDRVCWDWS